MKPVSAKKVSPKTANALRELSFLDRFRITNNGRRKQVFANLVAGLTERKPVQRDRFRAIATMAADRVLSRSAQSKRIGLFARRNPAKALRTLSESGVLENVSLLFESGARMRASWRQLLDWDILMDLPPEFAPKKEDCYRVMVSPNRGEWALQGIEPVLDALGKRSLGRDVTDNLLGSIGYFGLSIQPAKDARGKARPAAIIWTYQMRGIPSLPNFFQRRYKKWDLELLAHLEAVLKKAGVRVIAVQDGSIYRHNQKLREFYQNLGTRLGPIGFKKGELRLENRFEKGRLQPAVFFLKRI